jgi:hypothetical protein
MSFYENGDCYMRVPNENEVAWKSIGVGDVFDVYLFNRKFFDIELVFGVCKDVEETPSKRYSVFIDMYKDGDQLVTEMDSIAGNTFESFKDAANVCEEVSNRDISTFVFGGHPIMDFVGHDGNDHIH